MTHQGLGRVIRFDERSRGFGVSAVLGAGTGLVSKTWRRPGALDQGVSPQCVGYSLWAALNTQPHTSVYSLAHRRSSNPTQIYRGAQMMDEWAGEEYAGSSVLGGVKWMREAGLIREYRWCFGLNDVLTVLSQLGPVVVGTYWYQDMFFGVNPEPGYIAHAKNALRVSGRAVGGHAYELHGIDVAQQVVIATNSWGAGWGDGGRCYIRFEDLEYLLSQEGEAVVLC